MFRFISAFFVGFIMSGLMGTTTYDPILAPICLIESGMFLKWCEVNSYYCHASMNFYSLALQRNGTFDAWRLKRQIRFIDSVLNEIALFDQKTELFQSLDRCLKDGHLPPAIIPIRTMSLAQDGSIRIRSTPQRLGSEALQRTRHEMDINLLALKGKRELEDPNECSKSPKSPKHERIETPPPPRSHSTPARVRTASRSASRSVASARPAASPSARPAGPSARPSAMPVSSVRITDSDLFNSVQKVAKSFANAAHLDKAAFKQFVWRYGHFIILEGLFDMENKKGVLKYRDREKLNNICYLEAKHRKFMDMIEFVNGHIGISSKTVPSADAFLQGLRNLIQSNVFSADIPIYIDSYLFLTKNCERYSMVKVTASAVFPEPSLKAVSEVLKSVVFV